MMMILVISVISAFIYAEWKQAVGESRRLPANAPIKMVRRIARQYERAITRRGRQATDPLWLAGIWKDFGSYFVRDGQNFLMVRPLAGFFVASHFAPKNIRGGYRLLLKVKRLPVVFTVPSDLGADLKRMGYIRVPLTNAELKDLNKEVYVPARWAPILVCLFALPMVRAGIHGCNLVDLMAQKPATVYACPRGRKKPKGKKPWRGGCQSPSALAIALREAGVAH